jgi:di/tricarboxylate transporter
MFLRRIVLASTASTLILAAPAAAATSAAAGPSPTPLILEIVLAAVVATGIAVRRPVSRALGSVRRTVSAPRMRAAAARTRARV